MFKTKSSWSRHKAGTHGTRVPGVFSCHIAQFFTQARIATQRVILRTATSLWLLIAVVGCLGLLGVAFIPDSAQSSANRVVVYHPVEPVTSSRTIRYDRRPRRPSVVAIAAGIIVAVLVLAVVWVQMSVFHAPVATVTTRGWLGHTPGLGPAQR